MLDKLFNHVKLCPSTLCFFSWGKIAKYWQYCKILWQVSKDLTRILKLVFLWLLSKRSPNAKSFLSSFVKSFEQIFFEILKVLERCWVQCTSSKTRQNHAKKNKIHAKDKNHAKKQNSSTKCCEWMKLLPDHLWH